MIHVSSSFSAPLLAQAAGHSPAVPPITFRGGRLRGGDMLPPSALAASLDSDSGGEPAPPPAPSRRVARGPPPSLLRRSFPGAPWHRLPDYLTYIRCASIPALTMLFYWESPHAPLISSVLFALASFTDWLDGFLARRWDVSTAFGAFLDPVADKLMVSTALILLSGRYGAVVAVPSSIILAREIAVSALREWMAQRGLRDVVKVGMQGKVKTASTMLALTLMLVAPDPRMVAAGKAVIGTTVAVTCHRVGMGLLYLSTLLTVTSGSVYFKAAAPIFFETIKES
eukprot:CAMPEP_0194276036 /NCGR_PEP_ID=MMETSP0169-20130528/8724_1 /TAXON_ID=218684 /ORGANISM="Corethron pennatum, Strain L29A3" /LENGTH=283 /DNA_ID=CAMNT_0039019653 /DNA_START=93 /DNA_END=947 /DNA_ORIENTATION=-